VRKRARSPSKQELEKCMELHCRKWFGENIGPVEKCIDFFNLDASRMDLVFEMVPFDDK